MTAVNVEIPYSPRQQFAPFHARPQRFASIAAHRRAGKTVACINDLIKSALTCQRAEPRLAYLAPYHAQAKDVAWSYVREFAGAVPGTTFHESELRADLPNGGRVRLYGAENADRMRGLYLDGIVLDESADMDPRVWPEVIRPALSDRQGWAVFIGTPKGHNFFYDIHQRAATDPDWFCATLKASETKLISEFELAAARRDMSEDQYAQEYECSFEAAILGAYYGREMARADAEKRIARVPWESAVEVETWWDLGVGDSTAIWFAQRVGKEIRLIDYLEASGEGLAFYVKQLRERPYVYSRHVAPHDIEVRELGTGVSRRETAATLGIKFDLARNLPVDDGINAARGMMGRCWFDAEKCARGVEALKQYRRDYDEKLKTFRSRPRHDWCSHAADAFRYGAVAGTPISADAFNKPIKYATKGFA